MINYDKFLLNVDRHIANTHYPEEVVNLLKQYQGKSCDILLPENASEYGKFFSQKPMQKTSYTRHKFYYLKLLEFLNSEYNIDISKAYKIAESTSYTKLQKDFGDKWCFKTLKDIYNFFDNIADEESLQRSDMAACKSLCTLYYYGVSTKEIIEIKKDDVLGYSKYLSTSKDRYTIDDYALEILKEFANITYYRSFMGGTLQELYSSEYLFRGARSQQYNVDNLKMFLSNLNKFILPKGKVFDIAKLYRIYLFNKVENGELTLQDCKDKFKDASTKKQIEFDYNQWKQWLHTKE